MKSTVLTAVVLLGALYAQAAPNFSGQWKLNPEKSKLAGPYAEMRQERSIEHKDPELKVSMRVTGPLGDQTSSANFSTNGKETFNTMSSGDSMRSVVKWVGEALTFESTVTRDTNSIELNDRWTLSADGKTLTIHRRQQVTSNPDSLLEMTLVFDRA